MKINEWVFSPVDMPSEMASIVRENSIHTTVRYKFYWTTLARTCYCGVSQENPKQTETLVNKIKQQQFDFVRTEKPQPYSFHLQSSRATIFLENSHGISSEIPPELPSRVSPEIPSRISAGVTPRIRSKVLPGVPLRVCSWTPMIIPLHLTIHSAVHPRVSPYFLQEFLHEFILEFIHEFLQNILEELSRIFFRSFSSYSFRSIVHSFLQEFSTISYTKFLFEHLIRFL